MTVVTAQIKKKKANDNRRLSDILKGMLGKKATAELLREVDPDLLTRLRAGMETPTVAELVAKKIIRLAMDPKKSNQWAVELILDRMEGRSPKAPPLREDAGVTEEKLDALTAEHLNSIASSFARDSAAGNDGKAEPPAEETTDGPAAKLLGLSKDKIGRAQEAGPESAVAAGTEAQGGQ